jgi:hypothetical protein
MSLKLKRGTKDKIESALSDAMAQLEVEDSTSDDLKKKELALKRIVTKASKFAPCLSFSISDEALCLVVHLLVSTSALFQHNLMPRGLIYMFPRRIAM